ncbi:hypothetical protein BS50DRAFT_102500 [Corynespora cassiicola Philippines]|uniref:Yeast cell wall synthesis Kre9/Knh1-like N-terminal domain-containing protein n=1 Tax=Corynespora cassiicola Philippines TaxID=1448308 RepID=A0A2T2NC50_CORCC|nr:hypothetical protein BS50DRAFT_102500 [Corynespora cassiicola Philippines]
MRFFEVVISGAALLAAVYAVEFNDVPSSIEPGQTYTITYSPRDNTPTEIILREGDPNDLTTLGPLTTTATGGSFEWTVDPSLPDSSNYALEIRQEGADPNYSGLIALSGSDAESSAASSATPSATTASSAASSAASSSASASETSDASTLITSASSAASASASISPSASTNGTVTSATLSATSTGSRSSATGGADETSTGPPAESTGGAATLGSSPLALIFGAVAAMVYLN